QHYGLRVLKVRVAGKNRFDVLSGAIEQHRLQRTEERVQLRNALAQVETGVRGDLVVATARRVQLSRDRADPLAKSHFDPGMDILRVLDRGTALHQRQYFIQPALDFGGFVSRDDPATAQHSRV